MRGNRQSCINLKRDRSWRMKVIGYTGAPVTSGVTCWALPWLHGPSNFQIPCIISLNKHQKNNNVVVVVMAIFNCHDYLRTSMDSDVCMRC
jgi:hypothetical protein